MEKKIQLDLVNNLIQENNLLNEENSKIVSKVKNNEKKENIKLEENEIAKKNEERKIKLMDKVDVVETDAKIVKKNYSRSVAKTSTLNIDLNNAVTEKVAKAISKTSALKESGFVRSLESTNSK